jgi:hypothetical protein
VGAGDAVVAALKAARAAEARAARVGASLSRARSELQRVTLIHRQRSVAWQKREASLRRSSRVALAGQSDEHTRVNEALGRMGPKAFLDWAREKPSHVVASLQLAALSISTDGGELCVRDVTSGEVCLTWQPARRSAGRPSTDPAERPAASTDKLTASLFEGGEALTLGADSLPGGGSDAGSTVGSVIHQAFEHVIKAWEGSREGSARGSALSGGRDPARAASATASAPAPPASVAPTRALEKRSSAASCVSGSARGSAAVRSSASCTPRKPSVPPLALSRS